MVSLVASSGCTALPLAVTMNSGWVICSMIQIELLSKTLASSSDLASWGLAKTRFPPLTGVPAAAELVLLLAGPPAEEVALDPQPTSATMAQPTVRAMVNAGRCLTGSSGVSRGDKGRRCGMGVKLGHDPVPGKGLGKGLRKPLPDNVRRCL